MSLAPPPCRRNSGPIQRQRRAGLKRRRTPREQADAECLALWKMTVDRLDALDKRTVCNLGRMARRDRGHRNLVHVPVGQILAERWLLVTSAALAKSRPPAATGTTKKPSHVSVRWMILGTSTWRMTVEFSTSGVMNRMALAVDGSASTRRSSSSVGTEARLWTSCQVGMPWSCCA